MSFISHFFSKCALLKGDINKLKLIKHFFFWCALLSKGDVDERGLSFEIAPPSKGDANARWPFFLNVLFCPGGC